jgi:hypothetical protein
MLLRAVTKISLVFGSDVCRGRLALFETDANGSVTGNPHIAKRHRAAKTAVLGEAHTVTCQCGITVAAALTGTLVTIAHITELMDTHHSSRGIEFIDRFTLSQVSCPAIAPLVMRRTGGDVKNAPHALWLDS